MSGNFVSSCIWYWDHGKKFQCTPPHFPREMSVFPSNLLPCSHFQSKNSIRGNVGTDNQLTAIGSDTHFGFSREVQQADNRNPTASSFQPPTRHLSAVFRVFVTWCGVTAELVYKSTFAASCFENTVVGSIPGNSSSSALRPIGSVPIQLSTWLYGVLCPWALMTASL